MAAHPSITLVGDITFDDSGRRIGAGLVIILWQSGVPAAVYP
jgi:branched-chain amino acid transport system substrate-binding protein